MNPNKDLSGENNELAQKQADEIINIFKSIRKALSCKFEKVAKQCGFTAPPIKCYISFIYDAINNFK